VDEHAKGTSGEIEVRVVKDLENAKNSSTTSGHAKQEAAYPAQTYVTVFSHYKSGIAGYGCELAPMLRQKGCREDKNCFAPYPDLASNKDRSLYV